MIDHRVAREYAEALFAVARAEGSADALLSDFDSLEIVLARDDALIRFLSSPMELDEDKLGIVAQAFEGRATGLFCRLVPLLLRKNRIPYLLSIGKAYRAILEASRGLVDATVTSARTIGDDLERRLTAALERVTGRKVRLRRRIDPRLLGGFMVGFDGRVIDFTVRHRLDMMKEALVAAIIPD
ncbi:MAG: ATP synthase F1 subunit delta [Candidatus Fermentibacter sp.]|nr:ATP synthase F1 subunit delta [Candidatus Fermentibacter sp.]